MLNNIRTLRSIGVVFVIISGCAIGWGAAAFDTPKWSLAKKSEYSDTVIVGTITGLRSHTIEDGKFSFEAKSALAVVTAVLKGDPPKEVEIYFRGPAPEDNPDCCVVGKSYVFFLNRASDETYDVVNSRYGVYPILSEPVGLPNKPRRTGSDSN